MVHVLQVIERKPEEFKIACLGELRSLWPPSHNPFYAGFGNRDSDVVSYTEAGVPQNRILVINPQVDSRAAPLSMRIRLRASACVEHTQGHIRLSTRAYVASVDHGDRPH